ncbi:MAG TPA: GNAT family N-acetyltransferase [Leptolyngbyaceae cyanobacterium M33_DOE_097]|uniref:GNAT family N-acetyltransferase n=1 Tax=Oscillatoriales cyanobacterium SpSt-418 TaxID=2282169 RepID=A0A7C3PKN3_9CYAN|nr:GNAT family N-acetyltransferase [Leptolyngbyaceae cyanobacterium M33_DOE_097]
MNKPFQSFLIRDWQPSDREAAAAVISTVLAEYGLGWEPTGADRDVLDVEACYQKVDGEFWVVEEAGKIVGTAAYYPIERGQQAVEIRKMYLLPSARGQGVGRFLLTQLEAAIAAKGYQQILIETASILKEAVILYERNGYQPITDVETDRCDRAYLKELQSVV